MTDNNEFERGNKGEDGRMRSQELRLGRQKEVEIEK